MEREEAINIIRDTYHTDTELDALKVLIPELRESEDERIRKELVAFFIEVRNSEGNEGYWHDLKVANILAYLEKQKENPKSCDSIPSDCASDAKCEDRWQKVTDSLPDNPREVLCKDEAGNYFIGRYYVGEGWDISNYDDEDKSHHLNPPVSKWIDFPSEKQKEQKPWKVGANAYFTPEQKPAEINVKALLAADRLASAEMTGRLKERSEILENPEKYGLQKPAEWSEEDEKMLELVIANYEYMFDKLRKGDDSDGIPDHILIMDWLKSLRPSWKPSEEQMEAFRSYIKDFQEKAEAAVGGWNNFDVMIRLYENLKKL